MKAKISAIIGLFLFIMGCNAQSKNVHTVPAAAYAEKIKATSNAQILDVRTPEEFSGEHLDNAENVNWNDPNFVSNASKYNKSKPVFVYCKVGGRSKQAADKLSELGFTEVYNLEGGIMKWNAAGFSKPSDKIIGMCPQEYGDLIKSDKKILVDFYADWCEPCKKMTPYLLQMQIDLKGKLTISRLNADENKTLVSEMKLDELPVLILYENGQQKWLHKGFISENDLKKQLQ